MTRNTPPRDDGDTDTDTNTDIDNAEELGHRLQVDLGDAPIPMIRIVELAASMGGSETLADGEVWKGELADWAIYINGGDDATVKTYDPWGRFNLDPVTAVVFRAGYLAGVCDGEASQFHPGGYRPLEDLLIEAVEDRLAKAGFDYARVGVEH